MNQQEIFDIARPVNSVYEQHPGMEDPNALFNMEFVASEWEKEASDGVSTFAVPDLRELVLVGAGQNGTHPIADHDVYKLGEFKDDQLQTHTHKVKEWVADNNSLNSVKEAEKDTSCRVSREHESTYENDGRTGATTHGKQIGVNWFIKAAESTVWKRIK